MQLKTVDDLDELEKLALIDMSYSRLDTYEMCPSKFWFTYIQKEERVFGPAASLGNVIHSVLEDKVGGELVYEDMLVSMEHHRETFDPDQLIDEGLLGAGRQMIQEFVDRHEEEEFDVIGKEKAFNIIIGSGRVRGFIDLVTREKDGTIRITDYKSGKWEVAAKNVHENLQVGLYALAASIEYPDTPIYAELYYLRSGRRKGHLFTPDDMDGVYENALERINAILNDRNFSATPDRRPCTFCDFAKPENPVCKTGVARMRNARKW